MGALTFTTPFLAARAPQAARSSLPLPFPRLEQSQSCGQQLQLPPLVLEDLGILPGSGGRQTVTLLYPFKVLSKKSKQDSERQHVFSLMQLHKRMCACAHAHDIGRSLKK